MGKNKLSKFADMETFSHVFQYPFATLQNNPFPLKGKWQSNFFKNNHPIVLELGCGKGEYTTELAKLYPEKNFIGVDIKGARMWTGARIAQEQKLSNVAFIRTHIELIHHFFLPNEVSEMWITFPDPQMNKTNKRLTSTRFLKLYRQILSPDALIHLKTDSPFLFTYTKALLEANNLPIKAETSDLYSDSRFENNPILNIQTFYEKQWIARGLPIKFLSFVCAEPKEWHEPQIQIEKDTYRSFGRQQPINNIK